MDKSATSLSPERIQKWNPFQFASYTSNIEINYEDSKVNLLVGSNRGSRLWMLSRLAGPVQDSCRVLCAMCVYFLQKTYLNP